MASNTKRRQTCATPLRTATLAGAAPKRASEEDNGLFVAVRVRPMSERELGTGAPPVVQVVGDNVVAFDTPTSQAAAYRPGVPTHQNRKHKNLQFAYDHVFGEEASQQTVYEHTTRPLLDALLDQGFNCSTFAYGATGAGKTHTMLGTPERPGVMLLTMEELFRRIEANRLERVTEVSISMLEVYNELLRDVLVPEGASNPLEMREDQAGQIVVAGLSEHKPQNAQEVLELLALGNRNRTMNPTEMNATSSRSHAVLQIRLRQRQRSAGLAGAVTLSKLSMIDLAGSERASATKNTGERLVEGANINRSLLALGKCIHALGDASSGRKGAFVPYRDSKLTRLLKDSLGGNCKTVMIANISPASLYYEDTFNTLKYADRAKEIKMRVKRNVHDVQFHVAQYDATIRELQTQIADLQQQLRASSTGDLRQLDGLERLCMERQALKTRLAHQEAHMQSQRYRERWVQLAGGNSGMPAAEDQSTSQQLAREITLADHRIQGVLSSEALTSRPGELKMAQQIYLRGCASADASARTVALEASSLLLDHQSRVLDAFLARCAGDSARGLLQEVLERHPLPVETFVSLQTVARAVSAAAVAEPDENDAPATPSARRTGGRLDDSGTVKRLRATHESFASTSSSAASSASSSMTSSTALPPMSSAFPANARSAAAAASRPPLAPPASSRAYNLRGRAANKAAPPQPAVAPSPVAPVGRKQPAIASPSIKRWQAQPLASAGSNATRRLSLIPVRRKELASALQDGASASSANARRVHQARRHSFIPQRAEMY